MHTRKGISRTTIWHARLAVEKAAVGNAKEEPLAARTGKTTESKDGRLGIVELELLALRKRVAALEAALAHNGVLRSGNES
ncbi:MAG: hypothetical protein ABI548_05795 [Polyangiaceae bacterium]